MDIFLKFAIIVLLIGVTLAIGTNEDRESVFTYEGTVSVGTEEPESYISYTKVFADFHLLTQKNGGLWMRLTNVTFKAFSGSQELDKEEATTNPIPIPDGSEALTLPFIYEGNILKDRQGIITSKEDHPWSRSIKHAIAKLFRIDVNITNDNFVSFDSHDDSEYLILHDQDSLHISKTTSEDIYQSHYKIMEENGVEKVSGTMPSFKKISYDVTKDKDESFKKIEAINNIVCSPFNGKGEKFYVFVNQTFIFKEKCLTEMRNMDVPNMVYFDSNSNKDNFVTETGALDLSNGRLDADMDQIAEDVKNNLKKTFNYLHKSHITLGKKILNEEEHLDSVIQKLKYLDEKHIKRVYSRISKNKNMSDLLIKIISLVGTPASCSFILNLVTENKIDEELALDSLKNLPLHSIDFSEEFEKRLKNLIDEPTTKKIRNQAILTISNFISKSLNKNKGKHDNIINGFIENLKKSDDEREQLLYVYALRNIKSQNTYKEIYQIAQGYKGYSHLNAHVRAESLYGLRSQRDDKVLWILFANKKEHFEIRAAALNLLISLDRPENLGKMFWMLSDQNEDEELRHFFYTKLDYFSKTVLAKYEKTKIRANQILTFYHISNLSPMKSFVFFFENFVDSDGVGSALDITYYGNILTQNFTSIRIKEVTKFSDPLTDKDEFILYAHDNAVDSYTNLDSLDVAIVQNGKVLSFRSLNRNDMVNLLSAMHSKIKFYFMSQDHSDEIFIPTDMGIPVMFKNNVGSVAKIETQLILESKGNILIDIVYRCSEIYGFTSYNPITSTWVSIKKVHTVDFKLPFDVKFEVVPGNSLEITLNKNEESFGFQSFAYSHVCIKDSANGDIIKKTCPRCNLDNYVTRGADSIKNRTFLEGDCEHTGLHYKMAIFDCDQPITASYMSLINLNPLWNSINSSPNPGMCGVGFMLSQSDKYPSTHLKLSLQINGSRDQDHSFNTNITISYDVMDKKATLKSWNIYTLYSKNEPSWYRFKLSTVEKESPNHKFCLQVTDKWTLDHFSSNWIVKSGNDDSEEECPAIGSTIKMNIKGEVSNEMKELADLDDVFTKCENDFPNRYTDCLGEISSYRTYTYDVAYDLNNDQIFFWQKVSDLVRMSQGAELIRMQKPELKLHEDALKLIVTYPLHQRSINVSVITHDEAYRYDNIAFNEWYFLNYLAPRSHFMMYKDKINKYCEVSHGHVSDNKHGISEELVYDDGWAQLAGLEWDEKIEWMVKVKKMNNSDNMILHLQNGKDFTEIRYNEDFEVQINEKPKQIKSNVMTSIRNFDFLITASKGKNRRVFVKFLDKNIIVEYTPNRIRTSIEYGFFSGQCRVTKAKFLL